MTTSDSEHGPPDRREGLDSGFGDAAGVATGAVVPPPAIADNDLPGEDPDARSGSGIDLGVTVPAVGQTVQLRP